MNRQKKLAKQNTPLYKRVPTLNLVDYSDIKVPLVVIYDSPKDFPGKVVARVWDGEKSRPTNVYCEYENLKRCEDDVMSAGFVFKIRKMTDEQLVQYVNDRVEKARSEGFNQGKKSATGMTVNDFLKEISKIKGVGDATICKIMEHFREKGIKDEKDTTTNI